MRSIDSDSVYGSLDRKRNQIKGVDVAAGILRYYQRILNALEYFKAYVKQEAGYMPEPQKEGLLGIINGMSNAVSGKIERGELLEPDAARQLILGQYEQVMGIMKGGKYIEADKRLLLPGDPEFLLTLKKTLYWDFISSIIIDVVNCAASASQNRHTVDDNYLAPIMEKIAEITHTVANMERTPLTNATSIFRKGRIVISAGIELGAHLKEQSMDYQRLQNGVEYLLKNLGLAVETHLEALQHLARLDDNWNMDLRTFEVMKEKMGDLENKIALMRAQQLKGSNALSGLFRIVGHVLHI